MAHALRKNPEGARDFYDYDGLIRVWHVTLTTPRATARVRVTAKYATSAREAVSRLVRYHRLLGWRFVSVEPGRVSKMADPMPGRVELPAVVRVVGKPIVRVEARSRRVRTRKRV